MRGAFKAMIRDEDGATMVEYGMLCALVALVAFLGVQTFGLNLATLFSSFGGSV